MAQDRLDAYIPRLQEAVTRINRIQNRAETIYQSVAPGPMLSASQRIVLRALISRGALQVTEVANQLGVTLSAATGLVDRLAKAQLVMRERDQNDRRVVWVKITPEGREAMRAAEERRRACFREMVRDLSEEDVATLCNTLERLG